MPWCGENNKQEMCRVKEDEYAAACQFFEGTSHAVCGHDCIKLHYVPPNRPTVILPIHALGKSNKPMDGDTVYRSSYKAIETKRESAFYPIHSMGLNKSKMEGHTSQRLSYPGWYNVEPPCGFVPCRSSLLGTGPLDNMTTMRRDYVAKPYIKVSPMPNTDALGKATGPIETRTTTRIAYPPKYLEYCRPGKPDDGLKLAKGVVESTTTQRQGYPAWTRLPKEDMPWASKGEYHPPEIKMIAQSVYAKSYTDNGPPCKSEPIKPEMTGNVLGAGKHFCDETIYRRCYIPMGPNRSPPIHPSHALGFSDDKMPDVTTQRISYPAHYNVETRCAITPCRRNTLGGGNMESETTHKSAYTAKPYSKAEPIPTTLSIMKNTQPLDNKTTFRIAYRPPDFSKVDRTRVVPPSSLSQSTGTVEYLTTQGSSYVAWKPLDKEILPWAVRASYVKPTIEFQANSTYGSCYKMPGKMIEEKTRECCPEGCYCTHRGECIREPCPVGRNGGPIVASC